MEVNNQQEHVYGYVNVEIRRGMSVRRSMSYFTLATHMT